VLTLAAFTWKEGLRRRIIVVGLILTLAFVVLYGIGGYFAFKHPAGLGIGQAPAAAQSVLPAGTDLSSLMRQIAAYEMLSLGIFMASILTVTMLVFSASGMISGDAENGTLQTIVTRPLNRYQLLLGRYLGFATIFLAYLFVVTGLLVGLTWAFSGYAPPGPVQAVCLVALQGLILLALASVGTTVLPPLATGILVFMAYGLAFIAGVVNQIGTLLANHTAQMIGTVVSFLVPSDLLFRAGLHDLAPTIPSVLSQFLQAGPFGTPSPVGPGMLLYCLGYLVVALVVSCLLFARKDL
jgi:ABC-type transport system involved in multi-copper enzyme maturation permease subunit